jgi:5-methylcytosine-specific restriction endonuclease McrA
LHTPVLVLNATYEPIHITGLKRAIVLVLKGVARTEEENHAVIHRPSTRLPAPSVIRLLEYRRIPMQPRALSRKNILLRDRNTCQFCGHIFSASELTGPRQCPLARRSTSWDNLVACCHRCNNVRATAPRRGWAALDAPPAPTTSTNRHLMRLLGWRRKVAQVPLLLVSRTPCVSSRAESRRSRDAVEGPAFLPAPSWSLRPCP